MQDAAIRSQPKAAPSRPLRLVASSPQIPAPSRPRVPDTRQDGAKRKLALVASVAVHLLLAMAVSVLPGSAEAEAEPERDLVAVELVTVPEPEPAREPEPEPESEPEAEPEPARQPTPRRSPPAASTPDAAAEPQPEASAPKTPVRLDGYGLSVGDATSATVPPGNSGTGGQPGSSDGPSSPPASSPGPASTAKKVDRPPRPAGGRLEPVYPPALERRNIEGAVTLRVEIDERGAVVEARVAKSSGYEAFDQAAIAAARAERWLPALRDGRPTTAQRTFTVHFKLTG